MSFGFGKNESSEMDVTSASGEFKLSPEEGSSNGQVYIGSGTCIEGKFEFEGPTYINCKIVGNIKSNTSLSVGPLGEIDGDITGVDVTIAGRVTGHVEATTRLFLKKPASIQGDVNSPKVAVEDGVVFNGKCSMKAPGEIVDLNRLATV